MSGMLMDERFVAVFPSLVRAVGSLEGAVILQHIHWSADAEGDCRITRQQISDETGINFATVTRRLSGLRDDGWLASRRSSTSDSTQVYRVCPDRVPRHDSRESQTATPGGGSLATSESGNLQLPSLQKEEVLGTSETEVPVGAHTDDLTDERPEWDHQRHPSRAIDSWTPSGTFLGWLAASYRHVDVNGSFTRFRNFHYAKHDTSRSWDALFENWVSNDEDRAVAQLVSGTDDLGIPVTQSGKSIVPPALHPGDEGYFNPLDV